jgi:hypothetical protein
VPKPRRKLVFFEEVSALFKVWYYSEVLLKYLQIVPKIVCDRMGLRPKLTGLPFFSTFFYIANFCLFCRKGKSSVVTAQPFFVAPTCHHNLLCWESLLMLWRGDNSSSAHHVSPPPPSAPGGGGDPGRSGRRGK